MPPIRFTPVLGAMAGNLTAVPVFPGDGFGLGLPEAIGDAARAIWPNLIRPTWEELGDGAWKSTGRLEGELAYEATVTPAEETVDIAITLTNQSNRTWAQSLAFNCFNCGGSAAVNDYECVRHWVGHEGQAKRLITLPRQYGPRPTVQLYSVEGAPPGTGIPFVAGFNATPDVTLEGWMAIVARDGQRLAACASQPTLFLFQNMEYSCIHASPGFGPLKPGETGKAVTRLYFIEGSVDDLRQRVHREQG